MMPVCERRHNILVALSGSGLKAAECTVHHREAESRSGFMVPTNRLRLIASPSRQGVQVGDLCHARVQVESTLPVEVTIDFPEDLLELVDVTRAHRVSAGTHTIDWTLYAKTAHPDLVRLKIVARAKNLYQIAVLLLRVTHANS